MPKIKPKQIRQLKYLKKVTKFKCQCRKRNKYKNKTKKRKKSLSHKAKSIIGFWDYAKIIETLNDLNIKYPKVIKVEVLGESCEGRPIFLVRVILTCSEKPENIVFIEAGSNGKDLMAVASALQIIENLCKNAESNNSVQNVDYFIIPCTNPDAYEQNIKGKPPLVNIANNFPTKLALWNLADVSLTDFLRAAKNWKENYVFNLPEMLVLGEAVSDHIFTIKLFISLQEEGEKIVYPFGLTNYEPTHVEALCHVAHVGKAGNRIPFQVGSIFQKCGLTFGTVIDFLGIYASYLKFTYIIHMNDRKKRQRIGDVPGRAENVLKCIKLMANEVFNIYNLTGEETEGSANENLSH